MQLATRRRATSKQAAVPDKYYGPMLPRMVDLQYTITDRFARMEAGD